MKLIGVEPGEFRNQINAALEELEQNKVLARIWEKDHTVWNEQPDEIANRLDWLDAPEEMAAKIAGVHEFVDGLREEDYEFALLLGMGGSSLAPEVFRKTFGAAEGFLDLAVLDSTDPAAVQNAANQLDLEKTLFIVATKSGGTVETLSFFKYFYSLTAKKLGADKAGDHFIAITDPGSQLEKKAQDYSFRETFTNNPNIGGRYSALSFFGCVPAALLGVDLAKLLKNAQRAADDNGRKTSSSQSEAAMLGAAMAAAAMSGRDKITFISDPRIESLADWVEQLIAESTGKSGRGILPVAGEAIPADLNVYGDDRLFVITSIADQYSALRDKLLKAGYPVIQIRLEDEYDLGGLMFVWELATAIAGHLLDIQPFDQPNVESAKIIARQMVQSYQETGELPGGNYFPLSPEELIGFLDQGIPGDYIALHAYLTPGEETSRALGALQAVLRGRYKLAVTVGYGPRFLHSTGQLHKGDAGNGLFIQIVSSPENDIPIPDTAGEDASSISFGQLKQAQALGDAKALAGASRRVVSFILQEPAAKAINQLVKSLQQNG